MTSSLQGHLNLVIQEESIFDNVYKDIKGLIKSRKDILIQAIEEGQKMEDEERRVYHELFHEESKSLILSLQDVNDLLIKKKDEILNLNNEARERESGEFFIFIRYNNLAKVKALLKKGNADIHNVDQNGWTALMRARKNLEISKFLVIKGAKVDQQDKDGDTALAWVCMAGLKEVASYLLSHGASYNSQNRDGVTAGDYALRRGWNWNAMIAEANLSYFDHVFDCMVNADYSPIDEKKKGRKRKRGEDEKEKKEELPFLLRFMKKVINSDFMMSKNVFPKLSFNPGAEAGKGMTEFEDEEEGLDEEQD